MLVLWTLIAAVLGKFTYHQQGADWPGTCAQGTLQSPIDLSQPQEVAIAHGFTPLMINYKRLSLYQAQFDDVSFRLKSGELGTLQAKNAEGYGPFVYTATEIRFHAPSEHTVNGMSFDLEMQIVHSSLSAGNTSFPMAIVSVLFREGAYNPLLSGLYDQDEGFDLHRLLKDSWLLSDYFMYLGSATFPPCDEVVNWYVWMDVQTASWRQIDFFRNQWRWNPLFAGGFGNNRALQSRNGRKLLRFRSNMRGQYTYRD